MEIAFPKQSSCPFFQCPVSASAETSSFQGGGDTATVRSNTVLTEGFVLFEVDN